MTFNKGKVYLLGGINYEAITEIDGFEVRESGDTVEWMKLHYES
jgi:hypothetical protein